MSSDWIQSSKMVLEQIGTLEEKKDKDRLEYVRSLRFVIIALNRSLTGWMQWVSNPDIMTQFAKEELDEMNQKLTEFTRSFIEYDLEVTKKGEEKGLGAKRRAERKRREVEEIYI
jgi:hypothetical protein